MAKGRDPYPRCNFGQLHDSRGDDAGQRIAIQRHCQQFGGKVASEAAILTVNAATDVLTWHNDIARTGQNLTETILTTSNVNSAQFGKLGFYPVDGLVDAQPLYASNVATSNNGTHNLLIVRHGA